MHFCSSESSGLGGSGQPKGEAGARHQDKLALMLAAARAGDAIITVCAYCDAICIDTVEPRLDISWISDADARESIPLGHSSHGICPGCLRRLYPGIYARVMKRGASGSG